MFRPMLQELLNIEHFRDCKFKRSKLIFCRKLGPALGIVGNFSMIRIL